MNDPHKLQLKLRQGTKDRAREEVLSIAREAGAVDVRPLLPGSTDPELATLYIVEAEDDRTALRLMRKLRTLKDVEFVEPEVSRKLKGS